jgi:hypothetical protein
VERLDEKGRHGRPSDLVELLVINEQRLQSEGRLEGSIEVVFKLGLKFLRCWRSGNHGRQPCCHCNCAERVPTRLDPLGLEVATVPSAFPDPLSAHVLDTSQAARRLAYES